MIGSGPSRSGSRWKRACAVVASSTWTNSPSTLIPCRVRPARSSRECLPCHSKLRGNQAFLEWKPHRFALPRVFSQSQQITADALFGRPELQVLRVLDLAPELRRLACQHGEAKRLIRRNGLAERFGLNHYEAGLIENSGTHQVRLMIENGCGQARDREPARIRPAFPRHLGPRAIPRCRRRVTGRRRVSPPARTGYFRMARDAEPIDQRADQSWPLEPNLTMQCVAIASCGVTATEMASTAG